jgi:hypothetical protein
MTGAPAGLPTSPKPLTGDALAEWDRMVARLSMIGTLSPVDDGILYQHCQLFAETEAIEVTAGETAASIAILEQNLAGIEKSDLLAAFQEIGKLRALQMRYTTQVRQGRLAQRAFLSEFGLTTRNRLTLPQGAPAMDPKQARYLDGLARK